MITILIVLLILALAGGYRAGPGWGYYGGGTVGLILLILLILVLVGYIPHGRF